MSLYLVLNFAFQIFRLIIFVERYLSVCSTSLFSSPVMMEISRAPTCVPPPPGNKQTENGRCSYVYLFTAN